MQKMCEEGAVVTCSSAQCSYNKNEECRAPEIEVGSACPDCETFTMEPVSSMADEDPRVSQCVQSKCSLNMQNHCSASGITLGNHAGHADCMTFRV